MNDEKKKNKTSVYLADAKGGFYMYDITDKLEISHAIYDLEETIFYLQNRIQEEKQKDQPRNDVLGKLRYRLERIHEQYCELHLKKYE